MIEPFEFSFIFMPILERIELILAHNQAGETQIIQLINRKKKKSSNHS